MRSQMASSPMTMVDIPRMRFDDSRFDRTACRKLTYSTPESLGAIEWTAVRLLLIPTSGGSVMHVKWMPFRITGAYEQTQQDALTACCIGLTAATAGFFKALANAELLDNADCSF